MLRIKNVSVDMFFDTERMQRAADAATRKVLSQAGAFIRTAARHSIRQRKGPSPPGKPPSSHTGLLRQFIFFGYDPVRKTVVIGPMRLNKVGMAPQALEHGGDSVVVEGLRGKRRKRRVHVRPHPFMGPAMEQELPKFPGLWANSVK